MILLNPQKKKKEKKSLPLVKKQLYSKSCYTKIFVGDID